MRRGVFVLHVRPDRLSEYEAAHRTVWPELQAVFRECGLERYTIHLVGNHSVGVVEGQDVEGSWSRVFDSDVSRRWRSQMRDLLEAATPSQGPRFGREVFTLSGS